MNALNRAKLLTIALRRLAGVVSIAALISCGNGAQTVGNSAEETFVAVTQMVERPALNAIRDGIKDELAAAGYEEGTTLRWEWQSAKGSPVAATHIAHKYANAKPDVIVAIANPSARTVAAAANNTPVIFSGITDTVGEKLIQNTKKPSSNVSGVSDSSPIKQQLALIQEILPEIKTLGVIYREPDNTYKKQSGSTAERVSSHAPDLGIDIEAVTVLTADEVINAARNLVGTVDAIYVPTDKTVVSALEAVIQVGQDNQVPVFAGDADAVKRGAIATISFDYYDVGRQTGAMVVKVLRGSKPSDLAVEPVEKLRLSINIEAAETMGVALPQSITARADETL